MSGHVDGLGGNPAVLELTLRVLFQLRFFPSRPPQAYTHSPFSAKVSAVFLFPPARAVMHIAFRVRLCTVLRVSYRCAFLFR